MTSEWPQARQQAWHLSSTATTSTATRQRILLGLTVRQARATQVPATALISQLRHLAQEYFPKKNPNRELGGIKPPAPSFPCVSYCLESVRILNRAIRPVWGWLNVWRLQLIRNDFPCS